MASVNIYLYFDGNCEEAFNYYKEGFGGDFSYVSRYGDMPLKEGQNPLPEEQGNKIMHMSFPIGDSVIMGSDTGGDWASAYSPGNSFSISVNAESKEEMDRLFDHLSQGGQITMPLQQTFWGDYFGMCIDKFGVSWMFSFK